MENLSAMSSTLRELTDGLEMRLSKVAVPIDDRSEKGELANIGSVVKKVPHAEDISTIGLSIGSSIGRISSLLSRLEI